MNPARFPLYPARLLVVLIAWNVLILFDRLVLHYTLAGPFSVLALMGVAAICVSAPLGKLPGSWLVRDPVVVHRLRWLFWFIALNAAGMLAVLGLQLSRPT